MISIIIVINTAQADIITVVMVETIIIVMEVMIITQNQFNIKIKIIILIKDTTISPIIIIMVKGEIMLIIIDSKGKIKVVCSYVVAVCLQQAVYAAFAICCVD